MISDSYFIKLVRKMAAERGIDLHAVQGSVPDGRIIKLEKFPVPSDTHSQLLENRKRPKL